MTVPPGDIAVPASVSELAVSEFAAGGHLTPVWRNEVGGVTFRWDGPPGSTARFIKWNPASTGLSLAGEAARLAWAAPFTRVPEVIEHRVDDDGAELLVTVALPGRSAVDPRWLARPGTAAHALGAGLRALHDALPVDGCPFDWGVTARLARVRPVDAGAAVPDTDRAVLAAPPPIDRLVVCHADACAPNTLLDDAGRPVAHVDLGRLGVGDRWADLAVCAWSTEWNYGPGYEHLVYAGYGVEPDVERIAYYRLLWDRT
jgi:kanamycin kinase